MGIRSVAQSGGRSDRREMAVGLTRSLVACSSLNGRARRVGRRSNGVRWAVLLGDTHGIHASVRHSSRRVSACNTQSQGSTSANGMKGRVAAARGLTVVGVVARDSHVVGLISVRAVVAVKQKRNMIVRKERCYGRGGTTRAPTIDCIGVHRLPGWRLARNRSRCRTTIWRRSEQGISGRVRGITSDDDTDE